MAATRQLVAPAMLARPLTRCSLARLNYINEIEQSGLGRLCGDTDAPGTGLYERFGDPGGQTIMDRLQRTDEDIGAACCTNISLRAPA